MGLRLICPTSDMCSFIIFVFVIVITLKDLSSGIYWKKKKKNEISPLPLEIFFSVFVKSWKLDFNFNNLFITAISSFLIQKEFLPVLFFVGKKKKSQYFQNVGLPKKKKNAVFNYVKWFICIPLMLLFFRIFLLLLIMLLAECGVMARMVSQIVESITKATFFLKKISLFI